MTQYPQKLYYGTNKRISGSLKAPPVCTERIDLAALSMFPVEHRACSGFYNDIATICIWGTPEAFDEKDLGGFIYEYPSLEAVEPDTVKVFESVIDGMMTCGVQVYFIDDEDIFSEIVANEADRAALLKNLVSENQDEDMNVREF